MAKKIRCSACKEKFEAESDLEIGDTFDCPECLAELRLTRHGTEEVEEVEFWDDYNDQQQDNE